MITFSNNILSNSFSMRPKKDIQNNEFLNIVPNNDNFENDNILKIDLNSINLENLSLELALNVLQLKHTEYHQMTEQDMIIFFNEKMKLTLNMNNIIALKIILKTKLKTSKIIINQFNNK